MSNSEHSLQQRKSISYDASERPQQSEQTFASVRSLGAIACEADCLYCRVGEMHPSITDNTEQKERREMAEQTLTLDAKQDGITTKIENAKVSSEFSIPEDLYAGEKLPTITNGNQGNLNGNKPIVVKIPFDISDGLDGKKPLIENLRLYLQAELNTLPARRTRAPLISTPCLPLSPK